jgi:hypothetical protein
VVEVPVSGDLNGVLADGETLCVPHMLMDASGIPDGDAAYAVTDDDLKRVEDARDAMIARTRDRWKGGRERVIPLADGVKVDTAEIAFADYEHRLTNAWRKLR